MKSYFRIEGEQTAMSMQDKIAELVSKREHLRTGGGKARIDKQHEAGKLSARERVELLVDPDTFQETGLFAQHRAAFFGMEGKELPADGVVTGSASVDGRLIHLASQDFTVSGGSAGEVHSDKIVQMMESSMHTGTPFVFINDSGSAHSGRHRQPLRLWPCLLQQRAALWRGSADLADLWPCAGGAAYSPALTDFIIQAKYANMFITGPSVVKQVTGEVVTAEQLGGPAHRWGNPASSTSSPMTMTTQPRFAGGFSAFSRPTTWKIRRGCSTRAR